MSNLLNLLQESHKDLNQWFLLHQECLLLGDDTAAQAAFSQFARHLQQHIGFENQVVLAAMQTEATALRWRPDLYLKEHDKIEKMLARLERLLSSYYRLAGRRKRLALLELVEIEQTLKGVMEHHEQREETDLFLHMERVVSGAAVAEWQALAEAFHVGSRELKLSLKALLEE